MTAREIKSVACDLNSVEADGSFSGYASRFNVVDLGRDLVLPGAFARSLRERGPRGIKLLFQHDPSSREFKR
jgi:HK97 family phage prohead protease